MVAKQAQKGGIHTYEQLMLYLHVLQVWPSLPHTTCAGGLHVAAQLYNVNSAGFHARNILHMPSGTCQGIRLLLGIVCCGLFQSCSDLLPVQAQGKHKEALETVEGKLGDVMSLAAERRSLRASLHVCLPFLQLCCCWPTVCA